MGAELGAAATVMLNDGREAVRLPSLAVIVMFENVPTLALPGVPDSRPVVALNVAHEGRLAIVYDSVWPSGSTPTGVKEYAVPTVAEAAGAPVIVGARFGVAVTVIEKAGSEVLRDPSDTVMTMFV